MNEVSPKARLILESLQQAVTRAIDRKIRLGHYAVVWRAGKPEFIGNYPPEEASGQTSPTSGVPRPRS